MRVKQEDGCCRECGGELLIVSAGSSTMLVHCLDCGEEFSVEPDAFTGNCTDYYVPFLAKKIGEMP